MKALLKVLLGIVGVALVLVLIAEAGLRWYVSNQIEDQFRAHLEEQGVSSEAKPEVSFGRTPLVAGLVAHSVPQADIALPDTLKIDRPQGNQDPQGAPGEPQVRITGTPETRISAHGLDVSDPHNPVARDLHATTRLPEDFLLAAVQNGVAQEPAISGGAGGDLLGGLLRKLIRVTNLSANESAGALDIEFTNGAAVLSMRPVVEPGGVSFQVTNTTLFGLELPPEVSGQISSALSGAVIDSAHVLGPLTIDEVRVVDDAAVVTVSGHDVALGELTRAGDAVNESGLGVSQLQG